MSLPELAWLDPWDRQPEESDTQWNAFQIYRDMGYGRTMKKVADKLGVSPATIYAYSRKNDWAERIQQWDVYEDRIYQAEKAQALKDMGQEHAKLTQDSIKALMAPINAMLSKAEDPDFQADLMRVDFDELMTHVQRSARILDRLMKAERLAYDAPTEITTVQANHAHSVDHKLDDESLGQLAELFNRHILAVPSGEAEDDDIVDAEVIEIQQDGTVT